MRESCACVCVVYCLIIYLFFISSLVNKLFLFHLKSTCRYMECLRSSRHILRSKMHPRPQGVKDNKFVKLTIYNYKR